MHKNIWKKKKKGMFVTACTAKCVQVTSDPGEGGTQLQIKA